MAIIDNVLDEIERIVQNNIQKLNIAYLSKGGMEGWFQVEILYALIINQRLSVEREVDIGDNRRCDFKITDGNGNCVYIELKVDTEEYDTMISEYEADNDRVDELNDAGDESYAILISPKSYSGSLEVTRNINNDSYYIFCH